MTGDHDSNQVFFEDASVPMRNVCGALNQGWRVTITALMFERRGPDMTGV
jgi:alkylation response protein AidB-like acyl-CoA dehydrogenase